MKKHFADIVTACRILGSVLLLCFPAFSVEFYIIYIICGFSDMIDGTIARKSNNATDFGAKIDTAADLIFVAASLIKMLPILNIPQWLCIWVTIITMLKTGSILWGYTYKRQFIALHTKLNKITGLLLFLLPLTISFIEFKHSSIVVCFSATFAAIQEFIYISRK